MEKNIATFHYETLCPCTSSRFVISHLSIIFLLLYQRFPTFSSPPFGVTSVDTVTPSKAQSTSPLRARGIMAEILGITAFNSGALLKEWWEWVLVAIIGVSGLIGVIAFLSASYKSIQKLLRVRPATIAQIHATHMHRDRSMWSSLRCPALCKSEYTYYPKPPLQFAPNKPSPQSLRPLGFIWDI